MTLREFLNVAAAATGRKAPRLKLPYAVALTAGYAENWISRLTHIEPRIPLEGVRMAQHKMFVDCSRATRELGFQPGSVEAAIQRAARWYIESEYVVRSQLRSVEVA